MSISIGVALYSVSDCRGVGEVTSEGAFSEVVRDLECCRVTLGGSGVFSCSGGIAMLSCRAMLRVTLLEQLGVEERSAEGERGERLGSEWDWDFRMSLGASRGVCRGEDLCEESESEEELD